jgi:hypothetical protein
MQYKIIQPSNTSSLPKNAAVVYFPHFMEDIARSKPQRANRHLTTQAMLRLTLIDLAEKYDPSFEVYREFKAANYEGLLFKSEEEYSTIIVDILKRCRPNIIEAAIKQQLARLPKSTQLVYYIAEDLSFSHVLRDLGISMFVDDTVKSSQSTKNKRYNRDNPINNTAVEPQNEEIDNG